MRVINKQIILALISALILLDFRAYAQEESLGTILSNDIQKYFEEKINRRYHPKLNDQQLRLMLFM